jgi:hypothetical protein
MKHSWQVTRATAPHPDGDRRWDRAYQLLLEWSAGDPAGPNPTSPPPETTDASRDLRPRIDPAAGPDPDH